MLIVFFNFFLLSNISAQTSEIQISGKVIDEAEDPLIGVSIVEDGTNKGTITDIDGNFTISVNVGSVLTLSYIGYVNQQIKVTNQHNYTITLLEDKQILDEVVVIGYGSVRKKDLTGAVNAIGQKDFTKGVSTSPAQLIAGKIPGVQVTSNGGSPGAGSKIRIRGGASLNASNNPLIVIDGVPIAQDGTLSGSGDPLSLINPNDIESMNVLKDASATAIYGSRASNGVILITTKKGTGGKLNIQLNSKNSISHIAKKVDVLSANQYREFAKKYGNAKQIALLGAYNTDWQDEIYRTAFTTDNSITLNGASGILPYNVSLGYLDQNGILKTDNMKRMTLGVNLSPKFFDDHLSINLNLKGSYAHQRFGNKEAIGAAIRMDPTQPIKDNGFDPFNGYWTWLSHSEDGVPYPNANATKNPVALLESKEDIANVLRSIGNIQADYKFHFLPELRANLNVGYDISQGKGNVKIQSWGPSNYTSYSYKDANNTTIYDGGNRSKYNQEKRNLLFEYYMNYNKELKSIASYIDLMGGYSYQDFKTTDHNYATYNYSNTQTLSTPSFAKNIYQNTLLSYFARANYTLMDKYLLTVTLRRDGSSRFSKEHRWGTFPSAALAWRISEENFMKGFANLYNLKLRLGIGKTGQQEIDNYGYIAKYGQSDNNAYIQFGDHYYPMWRPDGFDANRKWESTTTYNVGLDYGFFSNRIYGSIDVYMKKTKDLLNKVYVASGENFTDEIVKNIGKMENKGAEFNITFVPVDNKDITWDFGFNATYNHSKITKLDDSGGAVGYLTGGISGGTGSKIQIQSVGYAPNSFYVYKQLYDNNGKPIDGAYADLNNDGVINENDKYHYKKPDANWYLGLNTNLRFKEWTLGTSLRANLGNYVYNNVNSNTGNISEALQSAFNTNVSTNVLYTLFNQQNLFSDYYIQNASFLKMDYITLGYDFSKLLKKSKMRLQASFTVQNVFTITKYKGLDPEVSDGIDNNFYPNPRTFTVGLNLNF